MLWGECDAASAILLYAGLDARVRGAVLLNPWVRTEALQAQAMIKHYYLQRLMQPSFWKKLLGGGFNPLASLRSLLALLRQSRQAKPAALAAPAGVGPRSRAPCPCPKACCSACSASKAS